MTVTALEIASRSVVLAGRSFGDAGPYEKVAGILRFETDPAHPVNGASPPRLALRNAAARSPGRISISFSPPIRRRRRRLLLDVLNRGRKVPSACSTARPRRDPTTPETSATAF
jgi:hypothetical protein